MGKENARVYYFSAEQIYMSFCGINTFVLENMSPACFLTYIFLATISRNYSIDIAALISPKLNIPLSNNQISYYIIMQIIHLHFFFKKDAFIILIFQIIRRNSL